MSGKVVGTGWRPAKALKLLLRINWVYLFKRQETRDGSSAALAVDGMAHLGEGLMGTVGRLNHTSGQTHRLERARVLLLPKCEGGQGHKELP